MTTHAHTEGIIDLGEGACPICGGRGEQGVEARRAFSSMDVLAEILHEHHGWYLEVRWNGSGCVWMARVFTGIGKFARWSTTAPVGEQGGDDAPLLAGAGGSIGAAMDSLLCIVDPERDWRHARGASPSRSSLRAKDAIARGRGR